MRCKNCGWDNPDGSVKCEKCNSALDSSSYVPEVEPSQNVSDYQSAMRATVRESSIFGNEVNTPQTDEGEKLTCRTCGYPLSGNMQMCPACGTPISRNNNASPLPQYPPIPNMVAQQMTVREDEVFRHTENNQNRSIKKCNKCGNPLSENVRFCPNCGSPIRKMSGTVAAWDSPVMQGEYGFCTLKPIAWARENRDYQPITYSGNEIILNRSNTDPNNQTITSQQQAILTRDGDNWYIEDLSASKSTMLRVGRKMKLEKGDIICLGNRLFEFND